jgi:hypothetical protein
MQGQVALGPSQVHVKVVSIHLEDRIRALIKAIVETRDVAALNGLGAELQRLLVLERAFLPEAPASQRR